MDASAEKLANFFRSPENFVSVPLQCIFKYIGEPSEYDDWDWGRLVYEWKDKCLRVRAVTRGGYVIAVEFLDPRDERRFGTVIETVWEQRPGA